MKRFEAPRVEWRVAFFVTFVLALLLLLLRTWQLAYLAGFVAGMISQRARRAVLLGAAGVALAWLGYLGFVFATSPAAELSALTVQILGLDAGAWWLLPFLAVILGAVVGAVGGFTGYAGAQLFLWSKEPGAETAKD